MTVTPRTTYHKYDSNYAYPTNQVDGLSSLIANGYSYTVTVEKIGTPTNLTGIYETKINLLSKKLTLDSMRLINECEKYIVSSGVVVPLYLASSDIYLNDGVTGIYNTTAKNAIYFNLGDKKSAN